MRIFAFFLEKRSPYGTIFNILSQKYSSRRRLTRCVQIAWNLADGKKSCIRCAIESESYIGLKPTFEPNNYQYHFGLVIKKHRPKSILPLEASVWFTSKRVCKNPRGVNAYDSTSGGLVCAMWWRLIKNNNKNNKIIKIVRKLIGEGAPPPLWGVGLGPHLTESRLGWGLPSCQVASWSIQRTAVCQYTSHAPILQAGVGERTYQQIIQSNYRHNNESYRL